MVFCTPNPFWKGDLLWKEGTGSNEPILSFQSIPSQKGALNNFKRVASPGSVFIQLMFSYCFNLTGGNTGNTFSIDPSTGVISLDIPGNLDAASAPSYILSVAVTDQGGLSSDVEATVTISVTGELTETTFIIHSRIFSWDFFAYIIKAVRVLIGSFSVANSYNHLCLFPKVWHFLWFCLFIRYL